MARWMAAILALAVISGCGNQEQNHGEQEAQQQGDDPASWEAVQEDYPAFVRAYENQQIRLMASLAKLEALPEPDNTWTVTSTTSEEMKEGDQNVLVGVRVGYALPRSTLFRRWESISV